MKGSEAIAPSAGRSGRDGDSYVLSGRKAYVSAVDLADTILILARTTPRDATGAQDGSDMAGFSVFLVDRESSGLTWERLTLPRLRSVCQYAIDLNDVRVPKRRRLGPEGAAAFAVLDALNVERILIPALVLGATTWLLRSATAYVKERKVFGDVPIGQYQAVQHPLAAVFLRARGLRHLLDEAATTYDAGANAFEVSLPTAAARFIAAEVAEAALNAGTDAFGSRGFEEDIGLLGFAQMVRLVQSSAGEYAGATELRGRASPGSAALVVAPRHLGCAQRNAALACGARAGERISTSRAQRRVSSPKAGERTRISPGTRAATVPSARGTCGETTGRRRSRIVP